MVDRFQIFETVFLDDELEEEFHNFFYKYNLTSLFTNEHRAGTIKVTYVDARSVINTNGSYHKTLKEFSDIVAISQDNQMYEDAVFKILYTARSFQKMMKIIKDLIDFYRSVDPDHLFNFWNIVFYTKELF